MADLVPLAEGAEWVPQIHQRPAGEPLTGGAPDLASDQGFANVQAQQLAKRTTFLKSKVDAVAFSMKVLKTSGSYVKPAGLRYARVIAVGGGGGGGGGSATNGDSGGAGGGGGGASVKVYAAADIPASVSYTVGSGGVQGFVGVDGAGGGSSVFLGQSASGGIGGRRATSQSTHAGPAGGAGAGGDFDLPGGAGSGGIPSVETPAVNDTIGGAGGSAAWIGSGGGGQSAEGSTSGGPSATGFGGGGAGGPSSASPIPRAGGNGAPGVIIIEEFF